VEFAAVAAIGVGVGVKAAGGLTKVVVRRLAEAAISLAAPVTPNDLLDLLAKLRAMIWERLANFHESRAPHP
jgi:hypothetical protein